MRDLLFKNLTSQDKQRKMISSCEITDIQGLRSIVSRHFVYIIKEARAQEAKEPAANAYIFKYRNTNQQREKFFCKIKGGFCAAHKAKLYLISFIHTLKIDVAPAPEEENNLGLTSG